jgi:hypothetical protein
LWYYKNGINIDFPKEGIPYQIRCHYFPQNMYSSPQVYYFPLI